MGAYGVVWPVSHYWLGPVIHDRIGKIHHTVNGETTACKRKVDPRAVEKAWPTRYERTLCGHCWRRTRDRTQ